MSEIKLYGDVTYDNLGILNYSVLEGSNDFMDNYDNIKFNPMDWAEQTVLNANFSGDINGSNFGGGFANIKYYKIFKTIGNSNQLYFVAKTNSPDEKIVEDYIVGDRRNYTYYVYPVCEDEVTVNGNTYKVEVIKSPLKTDVYSQNSSCIKLVGLIQDETNANMYTIDKNNMWNIYLNLQDNGLSLNYDKTFTDTQSPMSKENCGIKNYITKDISGLIGKIDCENNNYYIDTYDDICRLQSFLTSGTLKILIDLRGFIIPGDIEEGAKISYDENLSQAASVSFTFRQLEDFKNIVVNGKTLENNPLDGDTT